MAVGSLPYYEDCEKKQYVKWVVCLNTQVFMKQYVEKYQITYHTASAEENVIIPRGHGSWGPVRLKRLKSTPLKGWQIQML